MAATSATATAVKCDDCGETGAVERRRWCDECTAAVCADCAFERHRTHEISRLAEATAKHAQGIDESVTAAQLTADARAADSAELRDAADALAHETAALGRTLDKATERADTLVAVIRERLEVVRRLADGAPLSRERVAAQRRAVRDLHAVVALAPRTAASMRCRVRHVLHAREQLVRQRPTFQLIDCNETDEADERSVSSSYAVPSSDD